MVHPAGFEPATSWFEAKHSIQMSYGCKNILYFNQKIIFWQVNEEF